MTMYFDTEKCKYISSLWIGGIIEPWLGGIIFALQGNYHDEPEKIFTLLNNVWGWRIESLFDLIVKPIILLVVLMISLSAFALKLALMLIALPFWLFIAVTTSIKSGLPDYPQTWISTHD